MHELEESLELLDHRRDVLSVHVLLDERDVLLKISILENLLKNQSNLKKYFFVKISIFKNVIYFFEPHFVAEGTR